MSLPLVGRPTKAGVYGALLFVLGVDSGKQIAMDRLDVETPGPNYAHFSDDESAGFDEKFFQQITAEVLETKYEKGVKKLAWVKVRDRNEALDCYVYATAAAELCTPNWDYLEELYGKATKRPEPEERPTRSRRRGTMSRGVTL